VAAFSLAPDGKTLATLADARAIGRLEVSCWDLTHADSRPVFYREVASSETAPRIAFSLDGRSLVHSAGGQLLAWNIGADKPATVVGKSDELNDLHFELDGSLWATDSDQLHAWDRPGGQPLFRPWSNQAKGDRSGLSSLWRLAAVHQGVLVSGRNGSLYWFGRDGAMRQRRPLGAGGISTLSVNPSGTFALAGMIYGELRLVRLPALEVERPLFPPHGEQVTGATFVHDGLLITGSGDGTLRFWGPDSTPLFTLRVPGAIRQLQLTPNRKKLGVLLQNERGVRLYDLEALWHRFTELRLREGLPALTEVTES
jgi:WD40 repeat protein